MILQTLALTVMLLAPSPDHRFGLTEAMPRMTVLSVLVEKIKEVVRTNTDSTVARHCLC